MEPNVGGTDRTVRVLLGALALLSSAAVVVYGGGLTGSRRVVVAALVVVAAVMFGTAGVRRCHIDAAMEWNTCRGRK